MYSDQERDNIIMALLFASDEPLSAQKLAAVLGEESSRPVTESLERIKTRLEKEKSSIALESIAGGLQLATRTEYAPYVAKLYVGKRKQRLSHAGLEALAIIAYKQPVTRADIEQVRGVSCGGVISTLMERSLIKITGKAKVLGAPFLYGTGKEFLEYLGLNSIKDLPSIEELEQILAEKEQIEVDQEGLPLILPEEEDSQLSESTLQPQFDHHETDTGEVIIDEDERQT
jgi:segregation and condensation protein B